MAQFGTLSRRLHRGTGRAEYLFAVAFGILIILSLALTLPSLFGDDGSAPADAHAFQCVECDKELVLSGEEFAERQAKLGFGGGEMYLDCPECGAEQAMLQMTRCPTTECGNWYLPEWKKDGTGHGRYVCPECRTDLNVYATEQLGD